MKEEKNIYKSHLTLGHKTSQTIKKVQLMVQKIQYLSSLTLIFFNLIITKANWGKK